MQLNSGGWGMPTLISITMFATAQIDKKSATNSMTAPAPVLFPIVFNAFIHPLQNKNKTTHDNKIDTTLKNFLSNSQHRKVSVICMPYSNSKEPKHIFSAKMYWHFSFFSTKLYIVGTHLWHLAVASNEYPQHTFSWRNKKKYFYAGTPSYHQLLNQHDCRNCICSKYLDSLQQLNTLFKGSIIVLPPLRKLSTLEGKTG